MTTTPTFWGSQITISTNTTAGSSSIAALSTGGFFVAYQTIFGGTDFNVEGRRVGATGTNVSSDLLEATSSGTTNDRYGPEAVELGTGRLAVTSVREFSPTDYDPAVAFREPPTYATGPTSGTLLDGSGISDPDLYETERTIDGGFATMYQRQPSSGNSDILIRRFDSNGTLLGGTIDVDSSTDSQSAGDFTVLAGGGLVATWSTFNSTTLTSTLWLRLFDSQGNATTGRFSFAGTPNASFPQVEALESGGFVALWQDVTDGGIYHQRYDDRGFTQGARVFVPAGFSILPKITALADGGYIIGWSDFNGTEGDGSADGSITLQRYSASGVPIGQQLIIEAPGDQTLEDIQELADGRVALTYITETGDSTNVTRLVSRIIDPRDSDIEGDDDANVIFSREDDSHVRSFGGDDDVTGRFGDDVIETGAGNDTALGGDGDDQILGGSGNDKLNGGSGDDVINGGSGNDTLTGGNQDDVVRGGGGNDFLNGVIGVDRLFGDSGNDDLLGGGGADKLTGGEGQDDFVYQAVGESGTTLATEDVILDFEVGIDDIDLSAIDAIPGGANNAFVFRGTGAFTAAGQVRFVRTGGDTFVQVNTVGTGGAEMIIKLEGDHVLGGGDFIL